MLDVASALRNARRYDGWLAVAVAAVPALLGAVLLGLRVAGENAAGATGGTAAAGPQVIYARKLCSFSNDDARRAHVDGADGGLSVEAGGRTWWLFGDTLFWPEAGKQIEQNAIASSTSLRPDGCPRLEYYAPSGAAVPFIGKDGSLTAWPVGAWPRPDGALDLYVAYVYGNGPYAYWIGEVGVARTDLATMTTTIVERSLWDADSGFPHQVIGAMPIAVDNEDGLLRVALQTDAASRYLARVAPVAVADATAYEYWDGRGWSREPSRAVPMWEPRPARTDVEKLAAFDNGASFAWNRALGKWVAVHNTGFASVGARTADRLEGPWSEPVEWLDCLRFAEVRMPVCYSPYQHPSLAGGDGRTIFTTLTQMDVYETLGIEFTLGAPVHEYRRGDDLAYATSPPGADWADEGVAFVAAASPLPGLVPVYRWERDDGAAYGIASPGDVYSRGAVAFYAAPAPQVKESLVDYRPVYDWRRGGEQVLSPLETGLERYGYERAGVAFYAR